MKETEVARVDGAQASPTETAWPRVLNAGLFYTLQRPAPARESGAPPKQRPLHPRSTNSESNLVGRYCCQTVPRCGEPLILYSMLGSSASFFRSRTRRSIAPALHSDIRQMQRMETLFSERNPTAQIGAPVRRATRHNRDLREGRHFKVVRCGTEILF